jgi:hypothetical protein|tara:strand:- start:283 stop:774 length:492 start_codon:yes stop_codon:yes gene_type:complete
MIENKKIGANKKIVVGQIAFLLILFSLIYFLYPRVGMEVEGDLVRFNSINSNVIIMSKNPDFSNSKYVNLEDKEVLVKLKPGKYYWKSANNLIKSFVKEIDIDSEIRLRINEKNGDKELQNIGNVKLNITRGENGALVGNIILDTEQFEMIEDKGEYIGGQIE